MMTAGWPTGPPRSPRGDERPERPHQGAQRPGRTGLRQASRGAEGQRAVSRRGVFGTGGADRSHGSMVPWFVATSAAACRQTRGEVEEPTPVMTAGWPTGPPRSPRGDERPERPHQGAQRPGRTGLRQASRGARRPAGGFPARSVRDWVQTVLHGSMVPWFVATALYTHPTWQGTAAISLPS